jgi:predicted RNA-binding protein Jag
MPEGNSLINLGDISKPATVLIETISDAIGGYFKPYQIRRVAKAEAEAEIIKAQAQIEVTDLQRRALVRFVAEEARKQDNIEKITEKALPQLEETSKPENMEDDWVANFFDKCRIVSDEEMQSLWAKVLAGEANSPGTYSKRTVNFLSSLDKTDAKLFTSLCGFGWFLGDIVPLIFDVQQPIYNDQGINFNTLTHLDDIGLVSFNSLSGFKRMKFPKRITIFYYGIFLKIEFEKEADNDLELGKVLLTKTGQQLAHICGSKPVDGFQNYVIERWVKKSLILSSPYPKIEWNTEQVAPPDAPNTAPR